MKDSNLEIYHNEECEQGVLGCSLLEPDKIVFKIFDKFGNDAVELFYIHYHRIIWLSLLDLVTNGTKPDILQLTMKLKEQDSVPAQTWPVMLMQLQDSVPSAQNLDYYLKTARDAQLKRKAGTLLKETYEHLNVTTGATKKVLEELEGKLLQINSDQKGENLTHLPDEFKKTTALLDEYRRGTAVLSGLPTGYSFLDKKTGGLVKGEMIVIAGRPGGGKTALGMNIVLNQVIKFNDPDRRDGKLVSKPISDNPQSCLVFSMEMTVKELAARVLHSHSGANMVQLRSGNVTNEDYAKITKSDQELNKIPIWVDDRPGLSIAQIASKARQVKLLHGVDLILVDYLQLAKAGTKNKMYNRQEEVAEVSRGLKEIAKNLDVPILALAQLNRNAAKSKYEPPSLADLRESGQIEQDADFVGLLHEVIPRSPEEEELMKGEDMHTKHCKLIIAKQRSGPTGEVDFKFHKSCVRFETFDYQEIGKFSSVQQGLSEEDFRSADEWAKKADEIARE